MSIGINRYRLFMFCLFGKVLYGFTLRYARPIIFLRNPGDSIFEDCTSQIRSVVEHRLANPYANLWMFGKAEICGLLNPLVLFLRIFG